MLRFVIRWRRKQDIINMIEGLNLSAEKAMQSSKLTLKEQVELLKLL